MARIGRFFLAAFLAVSATLGAGAPGALADDPDFLTVGAGVFDFNDNMTTGMGAIEYRSDMKFFHLKPFGGVMVNGDGGGDVYLGVLLDIFFGRRFVVTPNFAPGFYWQGNGKDLGYPVEFRSGIEFAYRFDNRARLGVAVHHLSNASIDSNNPGTELFTLYYSYPLGSLFGK